MDEEKDKLAAEQPVADIQNSTEEDNETTSDQGGETPQVDSGGNSDSTNDSIDSSAPEPTSAEIAADTTQLNESTLSEETRADLAAKMTQQTKKKKPWLAIAILFILIAMLAGGGSYYWFVVRKTATVTAPQAKTKQDVSLIRYGAGEGTMNLFAPAHDDNTATIFMNQQIFEGLVRYENQTKIIPVLAKSWANPDSKTWVFDLKEGVKFHTGNTLTSKDVVYSYEQIKLNSTYADSLTTNIESLEAVGDNQVKIVTKEVDPILLNKLVNLFIVDSAAEGKADPMYGTGPYTQKAGSTPSESSIELTAFDGYHGGNIYVKEFHMSVYLDSEEADGPTAEEAMLADLTAGKLEIAGFLTGDNLASAKQSGYSLYTADSPAVYQLGFGTKIKNSPVAKAKVRRAIYESIDVSALLKAIGRTDTGTAASQLLTQFVPGYNPSITRPERNVENAKKLLAEAGYPNGVNVTLNVFSGAKDAGEEITRQLAEAGITVELKVYDSPDDFLSDNDNGTQEIFYMSLGTDIGDASDVFSYALQTKSYSNDAIDELITQANSTLDQAERLALLKQISKAADEDTAIAPLYTNKSTWAMSKPFVLNQDTTADLGVYMYKVYLEN